LWIPDSGAAIFQTPIFIARKFRVFLKLEIDPY